MKFRMETKGILALSLMLAGPLAVHAELATAADVPANMIAQAPGRVVAKPGGAAAVTRPGAATAAAPAGAKSVYVKRAAELRSSAAATATVVSKLKEGDRLTVLATEGIRLKVTTADGKQGYVAKMNTSDTPPSKSGSGGIGFRNDAVMGERGNVTSTRGLNPEATEYADANPEITPEVKADVENMKANGSAIEDADLEQFQEEGEVIAQ